MSGRVIKSGSTDQYCEVKVWTTADGVPNTTLVFNTAAMAIWYQIGNAAPVEVVVGGSPAPATMSAGGAHADWGIYHVAQGRYKIGLADAVVSAAANVTVWIVFTDCDSAPCEIDVVGYDKTAAAVGANTVVPATPANVTTALEDMELDKALIAQGAERAVNVDVNHRVHSHVYDMQANTITASALAADAGAEIYAAFGTGSNLTALATQASVNDIPTNAEFAAAFPANFASLGINVSGHVSRVTLVDTTTTNTDMRGTDSALTTKTGFALSATGLDLVTAWTTDINGSLSGNVGGIAGTIQTLDALDTAQDSQHGTTQDRLGYTLAALAGACADAGTAAETYAITIGVDTYTIDHTGLDATGNRGTAVLSKS